MRSESPPMLDRALNAGDKLWYHVRRSDWLWYLRRFFDDYDHVDIDRPIFLIGNQGAGLTLVSRILRRHPDVVSITGDHTYWSGAGEMQRVMVTRLPPELRLAGRIVGTDPEHPRYSPPRSWSYGCDDLVDSYHLTEDDLEQEDAEKFRVLIREAIHRRGNAGRANRFIDKSQVFTLKIRYIEAALADARPHFVLVTRNPYVSCYRAAMGKAGDMGRYARFLSLDERLQLCTEHWSNTIGRALADSAYVGRFTTERFEDVLREPEESVRRLCDFVDLDYRDSLLPAQDDQLPLGSRFRGRWHPLRTDVNDKYLDTISPRFVDLIHERCGEIAADLGYEKPGGVNTGAA